MRGVAQTPPGMEMVKGAKFDCGQVKGRRCFQELKFSNFFVSDYLKANFSTKNLECCLISYSKILTEHPLFEVSPGN